MRAYPGFHGWRHSQPLMHTAEVAVHEPDRHSSRMALNLFEKALVRRVDRRMLILMLRFWRSTKLVLTWLAIGISAHNFHVAEQGAGE
jgi:hypothetical protein